VLNQHWDDEYQNGYLDERDVQVSVDKAGRASLVGPVHFHCGQ
jgi:hypothetical protein